MLQCCFRYHDLVKADHDKEHPPRLPGRVSPCNALHTFCSARFSQPTCPTGVTCCQHVQNQFQSNNSVHVCLDKKQGTAVRVQAGSVTDAGKCAHRGWQWRTVHRTMSAKRVLPCCAWKMLGFAKCVWRAAAHAANAAESRVIMAGARSMAAAAPQLLCSWRDLADCAEMCYRCVGIGAERGRETEKDRKVQMDSQVTRPRTCGCSRK